MTSNADKLNELSVEQAKNLIIEYEAVLRTIARSGGTFNQVKELATKTLQKYEVTKDILY